MTARTTDRAGDGLRSTLARRLARFPVRTADVAGSRRAAVAVAVHTVDDVPGIWMLRRPDEMRAHPGQFALPGGGLDAGEDHVAAALRELHEEVGVAVGDADVLGRLDDYPTRSGYVIAPIVCWAGADPVPRPSPAEVARLHFLTVDEIAVTPRFVAIAESDRPVIQLPMIGELIHAPTAAIIHQFAELAVHDRCTRVDGFEQPVFAWR